MTRTNLLAFERASGQNLDALWHHWFEAAEGAQDYTEQVRDDLIIEISE